MVRYFISYKNLISDEKLEMDLDLFSPELVIIKKNKNGSLRVEPILYFNGYRNDLITYANKITQNKNGATLMVELSEYLSSKISPLYLKTFETLDDEENKNILKEKELGEIKLINYNCYKNMILNEINNGYLVSVNSIPNKSDVTIEIINNKEYLEDRKKLLCSGIGNDIYFYTEDEELLERYQDEITILEEVNIDMYKILSHKLVIIDSISQDRVNDLNNSSLRALYEICNNSIPINITEKEYEGYDITLHKSSRISKKGYFIVNFNIHNLMCDSLLFPLLKYINVYELKDGTYSKTTIEDYMKEKDILKYIKKPK